MLTRSLEIDNLLYGYQGLREQLGDCIKNTLRDMTVRVSYLKIPSMLTDRMIDSLLYYHPKSKCFHVSSVLFQGFSHMQRHE